MNKYEPLEKFLENKGYNRIPMSFTDIESVIGDRLPPSARKHRAWWSNNPSNSVITYAWLAAGYKTAEVNLEGERLTFVKSDRLERAKETRSGRAPIFGCMAGTVRISVGVDLTAPVGDAWPEPPRSSVEV
jgi:hypothetical protein